MGVTHLECSTHSTPQVQRPPSPSPTPISTHPCTSLPMQMSSNLDKLSESNFPEEGQGGPEEPHRKKYTGFTIRGPLHKLKKELVGIFRAP